jgi:septum formation topological specificity factor MinE
MRFLAVLSVILGTFLSTAAHAAPRDSGGSAKAVTKLQAMVRDITSERDALKTERDTIKTQLEADTKKLTEEIAKLKQDNAASASAESRLSSELAAQKTNNEAITGRLDKTNRKLLEVIEKYNVISQDKNELTVKHASLEDLQRQTKTELQSCEGKNTKMYEAAKSLLKNYEDKGVLETLLHKEPFLQIKTVEMETIAQEYEDKIRKEKYQHKELTASKVNVAESEALPAENNSPATEGTPAANEATAPVAEQSKSSPAATGSAQGLKKP